MYNSTERAGFVLFCLNTGMLYGDVQIFAACCGCVCRQMPIIILSHASALGLLKLNAPDCGPVSDFHYLQPGGHSVKLTCPSRIAFSEFLIKTIKASMPNTLQVIPIHRQKNDAQKATVEYSSCCFPDITRVKFMLF